MIEDAIVRLGSVLDPIEAVKFDPFDPAVGNKWKELIEKFHAQVTLYEGEAKFFIDESFKSLRSAEGAFDMLQDFRTIRTRKAINEQLQKKYDDVLLKFVDEVNDIKALFNKDKDSPQISKNQPPVAGSIRWAYSLFLRIKGTVLRFQSKPEMLQDEVGKDAIKQYITVARTLRGYQTTLHEQWCHTCNKRLPELLKMTLLQVDDASQSGGTVTLSAKSELSLNYAPELTQLITEAKYLDLLTLSVPEVAINVTLQEERHLEYKDGINALIRRFHNTLRAMEPSTEALLSDHLKDLAVVLAPGLRRLNWNSLGILYGRLLPQGLGGAMDRRVPYRGPHRPIAPPR
jgi:dynein heavy chain